MSAWTDRILQEFPADLSSFWIACDPDDLLLDERILHSLRERGFEVLPFEDPIAFRIEYEERYRAAWDRGQDGSEKALILQLHGTDLNALPWDYVCRARQVNLSLADLFPKLSYSVVRQIGSEYHEALFDAQRKHAHDRLGDSGTRDFILTHLFRISPHLISRPEDLWRELLRLHYRGEGLPFVLADHVSSVLSAVDDFAELPIAELFTSKSRLLQYVQLAWRQFVSSHAAADAAISDVELPDFVGPVRIPFDHPDVRVVIDSMFLEGALRPLRVAAPPAGLPSWARVGVLDDPDAQAGLVAEAAKRLLKELPEIDASYRDWVQLSQRLGESLYRFHNLPADRTETVAPEIEILRNTVDERLREWVARHYTDLLSVPVSRAPAMVHHIPRYLALRRSAGAARVALLVIDGLAMDQWMQIRHHIGNNASDLVFDEGACFAWLPTLTSVSRQALFSGLKPREFANSIETTAREPSLWSRFWQDHGLRTNEVAYRKAIKRVDQLGAVDELIADPAVKALGLVVDIVDEFVHAANLGKRGIARQITDWCETGFVERLVRSLLDRDFQIFLTADHGNTEAVGTGRLNQGVIAEIRGERVRVYRSEALAAAAPSEADALRLDIPGLPDGFVPIFANGRGAFVGKEDPIVAHGGLSVEELLVPFVEIRYASA